MSATQFLTIGDGTRVAYHLDGSTDKPVLVLSNSIGTSLHMWEVNMPALTQHFRVLRYDTRGHGASDAPAGAYSLDRLGRDVIELIDGLDIKRFHFLGLSLGGFIGQWLGIHAPERIDRLILSNTAAHLGPAAYFDRSIADLLKAPDMQATAETFLKNWFPPAMFEGVNPIVEKFHGMLLSTDKYGLAGAWAAVRDADLRRTIALIDLPTLVIAGKDDTVTSAELGAAVASRIPRAQLHVLPTVHLSNVELPDEYVGLVIDFLTGRRLH